MSNCYNAAFSCASCRSVFRLSYSTYFDNIQSCPPCYLLLPASSTTCLYYARRYLRRGVELEATTGKHFDSFMELQKKSWTRSSCTIGQRHTGGGSSRQRPFCWTKSSAMLLSSLNTSHVKLPRRNRIYCATHSFKSDGWARSDCQLRNWFDGVHIGKRKQ